MKRNGRVGFCILLLALVFPVQGEDAVSVFVSNGEAYAYLEPQNEDAKFLLTWGNSYSAPAEQIKEEAKWILIHSEVTFREPMRFTLREGGEQSIRRVDSYWVKRSDIVLESELKKVSKGWPIRYLFFEAGDMIESLVFSPDGEAKVFTWGENYEPIWQKGHVFSAGGVVVVKYPAPGFEQTYIEAGYDRKNSKLYPSSWGGGEFFMAQGLFSDKRKPVLGPGGECLLDCPVKRNKK